MRTENRERASKKQEDTIGKKIETATKKKRVSVAPRTKKKGKAILEKRRKNMCQRWCHEHETQKILSGALAAVQGNIVQSQKVSRTLSAQYGRSD